MSKFLPPKTERFISKAEANRLMKKLKMKYGADLAEIEAKAKRDMELYGYIQVSTEAMREHLIEKIKAQS